MSNNEQKLLQIQIIAISLNDKYLLDKLKEISEQYQLCEITAVLNPNNHNQIQKLNEAKLNQLKLILKLRDNILDINELSLKLEYKQK